MTYQLQLDNNDSTSFNMEVQAGTVILSLSFLFPDNLQDQYDMFQKAVTNRAQVDPIELPGGQFNRTYDYIDYYLSIDDIDTYIQEGVFPLSLHNKEEWLQKQLITERIALCNQLSQIRNLYKETLIWQVTVAYLDETNVCRLIPGGWYRNQDDIFSIRFVSDRISIGKNDLPYVTIEVEVYNE